MKKLFKTVSILLLCGMLSCPVVEAQGRGNRNNSGQRPSQSQSVSRSSSSRSSRSTNDGGGQRPGASGNNQGNRSNGGNNQGNRPNGGGNVQQGNRPNGGGKQGNRLNGGGNFQQGNRLNGGGKQGNRLNGGGFAHNQASLPPRQHMPPMRPFNHPTPPPAWRPVGRVPVLSTILGMTFGTALNLSVNYLINQGYNVVGYGDGMVYLNNVMQFNYLWPDATLYYGNNGGLDASSFVYSTVYQDMGRYNSVYNNLYRLYGAPVSVDNSGVTMSSTWFGNNGQFVSLSFGPSYTSAGQLRYFTTLSFGN
jgi:hypothetical protein